MSSLWCFEYKEKWRSLHIPRSEKAHGIVQGDTLWAALNQAEIDHTCLCERQFLYGSVQVKTQATGFSLEIIFVSSLRHGLNYSWEARLYYTMLTSHFKYYSISSSSFCPWENCIIHIQIIASRQPILLWRGCDSSQKLV